MKSKIGGDEVWNSKNKKKFFLVWFTWKDKKNNPWREIQERERERERQETSNEAKTLYLLECIVFPKKKNIHKTLHKKK